MPCVMEGRIARSGSEIISKKAFLAAKDWMSWARSPVAAGPFKVKELRRTICWCCRPMTVITAANRRCREVRYQVVPEVSGRVNGLLSGEYDFVTDVPPDQIKTVEANPKFEVVGGPVLNHRIVVFDKNHPQLAHPKIRLAMAHAIDRDAIVKSLWAGRTNVPAGLQWEYYGPMFQKDWTVPKYDPKLAAQLVKDAGYKGEPIPFPRTQQLLHQPGADLQILVEMWRAGLERAAADEGELAADLRQEQRRAWRA